MLVNESIPAYGNGFFTNPCNCFAKIFVILRRGCDDQISWMCFSQLCGKFRIQKRLCLCRGDPVIGIELTIMNAAYARFDEILLLNASATNELSVIAELIKLHAVGAELVD